MKTIETRPYFVIGDVLSCTLCGALVGVVCAALFGPAWNMWVAMLVGMALGMVLALLPALGLGALFGAMEVMVPVMLTGMVAGMVVSMRAAMGTLSVPSGVEIGCLSGLGALAVSYLMNAVLRRRVRRWT